MSNFFFFFGQPKNIGEGIVISQSDFSTFKKLKTASLKISFLLKFAFSAEELQRSNYGGGGRKGKIGPHQAVSYPR